MFGKYEAESSDVKTPITMIKNDIGRTDKQRQTSIIGSWL